MTCQRNERLDTSVLFFFRLVLGLDKASKLSRGGKPPENEEPRA